MQLYTSEEAITAKILRNPGGWCTSVLAGTHKKRAFSTVFDTQQLHERDATEPLIWPNVYLADALPREPIRMVRAPPEQTAAWPKDGDVTCSHGTIRPAVGAPQYRDIYYMSRDHPKAHELTNHMAHAPSVAI